MTADQGRGPEPGPALSTPADTVASVLELLPVGALVVEPSGRIGAANHHAEAIFGYERGGLTGLRVEALVPHDLTAAHVRDRRGYLEHPRARPMGARRDLVGVRRDGSPVPIEVALNATEGPGSPVLAIVHDVREQRRTADELRAWADLFHHMELAVVIGGADTSTMERVNPAFARMHGYTAPELAGRDLPAVFAPQARADLDAQVQRAHDTGHHVFESLHLRKDGTTFPVLVDVTAVKDARGAVRYRAVHVQDLTDRKRDEAELRRQGMVAEHMAEGVALIRDADGAIVYTNRAWDEMFGYEHGELLGRPVHVVNAPTDLSPSETARLIFREVARNGVWHGEIPNLRKDGTRFSSEGTVTAFEDPEFGKVWLAVQTDVTERRLAATALRESEARFRTVFEQGPLGRAVMERDSTIVEANEAFAALLGLPVRAVIGRRLLESVPVDAREEDAVHVERLFDGELDQVRVERRYVDPAGQVRWAQVTASLLPYEPPGQPLMLSMVEDVTARKEAQDRLAHLATHDELTGLPNRAFAKDRLRQAQLRSERSRQFFALLFVDLDGFKEINDTLGHEVGDLVLLHIGRRMREALRPSDTAARLGGDEFLLLAEPLATDPAAARAEAAAIARRVSASVTEPVRLRDRELRVTASIGVVLEHGATQTASALIARADQAMYRAKDQQLTFQFAGEWRVPGGEELEADESALREAFSTGALEVHYQPVIDLRDEAVLGFEALLRWRHPRRGLLLPQEFLDTAERSGLIVPIGAYVLRTALARLAACLRSGDAPLFMAVNVSTLQLGEHGFGALVASALREHDLPADWLHLEIAEGRFIEATSDVLAELEALRGLGVHVGLDDFGTGWSSLTRLQRFPVDFLKLDRSFVTGLERDSANAAIVEAVVGLGRALDLEIVPEGVERREEAGLLTGLGCRRAQGWLFGRATPGEDLAALLAGR